MSQVVLITGATSGIGQETAELLASQGWKVVVSGRRLAEGENSQSLVISFLFDEQANLDKVVDGIRNNGGEATFIQADVSTEANVKALIEKSIAVWGHLDAAVNNAGISNDSELLENASTERFQEMFQVNVLGVFWCMKYQLQHMVPRKHGRIVNLASIAGLHGIFRTGGYCATKHAVVGLTKTAAIEYATSGVTINAVAPGAIKTSVFQQAIDSGAYTEETIADLFPMKRMGAVSDIARAIKFLIDSPFATGSVLAVDGGLGAA
ncbi:hypothetical protein AnigIFM63604_002937 [Aspergillus niger]|uniref:3-oxoacyl-[acyl-carrier-protein] reductase n=1 Tax=Aspergillus niger TaxID=5061 RepID=A0A9W6AA26_ASPNG|nr:hypothetical protein AnigIFM63604_002937 [Aspergillus niger]